MGTRGRMSASGTMESTRFIMLRVWLLRTTSGCPRRSCPSVQMPKIRTPAWRAWRSSTYGGFEGKVCPIGPWMRTTAWRWIKINTSHEAKSSSRPPWVFPTSQVAAPTAPFMDSPEMPLAENTGRTSGPDQHKTPGRIIKGSKIMLRITTDD